MVSFVLFGTFRASSLFINFFIFKDDPTIKRVNRWDKQSKIDADNEQEYAVSSPSSNSSPSLNKQGML